MNRVRIGINGIGRIGRTLIRQLAQRNQLGLDRELELVAINNPGSLNTTTHLLKYDSVHGPFKGEVRNDEKFLYLDKQKISFYSEIDPLKIPWEENQVDIVIDCTGKFKDKPGLGKHLKGSVKKVIMCAPGSKLDGTFVMGINTETYRPDSHHIISNASCTTNCLAPVAKILHQEFGIESGFMTTVHAYTSDQNLLDNSHSDIRRARAAALSMIPTSTGAAKALGEVIPELKGKLDGYAVRVPTPNVSMIDLTVNLKKSVTKESLNQSILQASQGAMKGILAYIDEELVSCDFVGRKESCLFDAPLTNVIGQSAKIVAWYDNEVGYSNRVLDLALFVGKKI